MEIIKEIGTLLLVTVIWYLFCSLIAWDLNPGHWSGFGRFMAVIIFVILLVKSPE